MNVMEPDVCTAPTDSPLNKGRRGGKRSRVSANTLTTPLITDHFTKLPRIMEVVEECEMSPLSPATLSFLVDSSVQAENHGDPGADQVVEPQPDLDSNVCSLMNKDGDGEQSQQDSNAIVEPTGGSGTRSCGADQVMEPQPDLGLATSSLIKKGEEQSQQDSSIITEPSGWSGTESGRADGNQGRQDVRLVVEPQPNDDSMNSLSPSTTKFLMESSLAAEEPSNQHQGWSPHPGVVDRSGEMTGSMGSLSPAEKETTSPGLKGPPNQPQGWSTRPHGYKDDRGRKTT